MNRTIGSLRGGAALVIAVTLICAGASAGNPAIDADQIVDHLDSSKTFVQPRILVEGQSLGIRQGIPGACRLFGMEGYLKEDVVWSADLKRAVEVNDDGTLGDVEVAHYVESMACTSQEDPMPKLTVRSTRKNTDGSVTVRLPEIHSGPRHFFVVSGHAGVCRLLGYNDAVKFTREWSKGTTAGVSLAPDGQIYEKALGTYFTALGCRNDPQKQKNLDWE